MEEIYKRHTIKISFDEDPQDPREWDNLGTIWTNHGRYSLGDRNEKPLSEAIDNWDDAFCDFVYNYLINYELEFDGDFEAIDGQSERVWRWINKNLIYLPLYLLDHSGLRISTGSFSNNWDSGQIGFIYITKTDAKKEWGWQKMNKKRKALVEAALIAEVDVYDSYLSGDVYCYKIETFGGTEIDSCCGFYSFSRAREAAREVIDSLPCQDSPKDPIALLKEFIELKNKMLGYEYLNGEAFEDLWPYDKKLTQQVLNKLNPKTDSDMCPWCIVAEILSGGTCEGCEYAKVFKNCNEAGSNYDKIATIASRLDLHELFSVLDNQC